MFLLLSIQKCIKWFIHNLFFRNYFYISVYINYLLKHALYSMWGWIVMCALNANSHGVPAERGAWQNESTNDLSCYSFDLQWLPRHNEKYLWSVAFACNEGKINFVRFMASWLAS